MFTGIIESQGIIKKVITESGGSKCFWIRSPLSSKLKPDQSVSHDGVCLTVEEVKSHSHRVTAVEETLQKTTLAQWQPGYKINLERCLKLNDRLDGHLVQGRVACEVLVGCHPLRMLFHYARRTIEQRGQFGDVSDQQTKGRAGMVG